MLKIYSSPRISANPLCEYVAEATASRRTSIIKQCKFPAAFITRWYNQAEDLLSFYLSEIRDDPRQLAIEIERLRTNTQTDLMEKKYSIASAASLRSFLQHELVIREALKNYELTTSVNDSNHKFILNGVQISLRPELLLRDSDGRQQLGFVKLCFGKEKLSDARGELMACLIKYYFESEHGFNFNNKHCIVIDVPRGKIFYAPKTFRRRIADIEAACKEISDRWELVSL